MTVAGRSSASLVLATRRSPLALAQAHTFASELCAARPGLSISDLLVVTTGDRVQDRALAEVGGKGVFVKEIEEALVEKRADFAVHSIKDVPALLAPGLVIACVPRRADPRDVLVSRDRLGLRNLPAGATVGTSSLRRSVLLQRARPDLRFVPLRGNVDTRLRKVREGQVDAAVVARAGLDRLDLSDQITEDISVEVCIPAVGQGALGIECRNSDEVTRSLVACLHDRDTAVAVAAERGVMLAVEGNCRIPIAAHATRSEGDQMLLRAMLAEPDGTDLRVVREAIRWPASEQDAERFGREVGARLRLRSV